MHDKVRADKNQLNCNNNTKRFFPEIKTKNIWIGGHGMLKKKYNLSTILKHLTDMTTVYNSHKKSLLNYVFY